MSGKNLVSAPKTYNMYERYYPTRKTIGSTGIWDNSAMTTAARSKAIDNIDDFMRLNAQGQYTRLDNAPVYLLD